MTFIAELAKHHMNANKEGRKPKKLLDSDYLIGVYDEVRIDKEKGLQIGLIQMRGNHFSSLNNL